MVPPACVLFQVTVEQLIMMPHIVTMANQILTINISADVSVNQNPSVLRESLHVVLNCVVSANLCFLLCLKI